MSNSSTPDSSDSHHKPSDSPDELPRGKRSRAARSAHRQVGLMAGMRQRLLTPPTTMEGLLFSGRNYL